MKIFRWRDKKQPENNTTPLEADEQDSIKEPTFKLAEYITKNWYKFDKKIGRTLIRVYDEYTGIRLEFDVKYDLNKSYFYFYTNVFVGGITFLSEKERDFIANVSRKKAEEVCSRYLSMVEYKISSRRKNSRKELEQKLNMVLEKP